MDKSFYMFKNHFRCLVLGVYRCLLTSRLHGKAAELCLAMSGNNRVTTTTYMITLIASTAHICVCMSFYHVVLVNFNVMS